MSRVQHERQPSASRLELFFFSFTSTGFSTSSSLSNNAVFSIFLSQIICYVFSLTHGSYYLCSHVVTSVCALKHTSAIMYCKDELKIKGNIEVLLLHSPLEIILFILHFRVNRSSTVIIIYHSLLLL